MADPILRAAGSIHKGVPMIVVPDIGAALDWYVSIGFKELARFEDEDDHEVNFGMVGLGKAELMFRAGPNPAPRDDIWLYRDVTLWLYTDDIDELYGAIKSRHVEFAEDIYNPFYGGRQFSIKDPNGYIIVFLQPG